MLYAQLSSPEIGRVAAHSVALLPLAAVEQHGAHLPVSTDADLVSELARRAEAALPEVVALLPALWPGCSHHHLGFPGTLSISSETYIRVLCDLCESLIAGGFTKIFLLNGHGGNHIPFCEALYRLGLAHRGVWISAQSYWHLASKELAGQDFMQTPRLTHACEYETSMMMALDEGLVDLSKAEGHRCARESAFYDPLSYTPSRVVTMETFDQMTPGGAMGSPELSTAQKGRRLFDLITPPLVDFLREFSQWKPKAQPDL